MTAFIQRNFLCKFHELGISATKTMEHLELLCHPKIQSSKLSFPAFRTHEIPALSLVDNLIRGVIEESKDMLRNFDQKVEMHSPHPPGGRKSFVKDTS